MNFFKGLGKIIGSFFKSPAAKKIGGLAVNILKELIGTAASSLQQIAREEVYRAELEGGTDKYERAFKAIRGRLYGWEDISENAINIAIETSVAAMKKELEDRKI